MTDQPRVDQISVHDVKAEDISVETSIHDYFAVVIIKVGQFDVKLFTELDQVAGILRNLGK